MSFEDMSRQLSDIAKTLRGVRVQVILLALKDTKQKHPRVVILENQLSFQLQQQNRNNVIIDDILEQLDCMITVKPEHHQIAQYGK